MTGASEETSENSEKVTPLPFCIKNTFIQICDGFGSPQLPRRSASAPAKRREHALSSPRYATDTLPSVKSTHALSESSTSCGHISCGELDLSDESSEESETSDRDGDVSLLSVKNLLAQKAPSRTKLNSGAKAWTPSQGAGISFHMPLEVKAHFEEIMNAAQIALMRSVQVQQVGKLQSGHDWFLEASCQQTDLRSAQQNLFLAQQVMLCAAERSTNVYIIGYEKNPFMPMRGGFGFSAQLALVEDDTRACWDLLKTGICSRGCKCRWQHPSWQVSLNTVMRKSEL